jgi:hypothetical protein
MSGMWWKRVSMANELPRELNMEVAPYFSAGFFFFSTCAKKIENSLNGLILSACTLYGGA